MINKVIKFDGHELITLSKIHEEIKRWKLEKISGNRVHVNWHWIVANNCDTNINQYLRAITNLKSDWKIIQYGYSNKLIYCCCTMISNQLKITATKCWLNKSNRLKIKRLSTAATIEYIPTQVRQKIQPLYFKKNPLNQRVSKLMLIF